MYNGIMISDVPNMAFVMGYTNASWTLKADIASLYFTKLLNHMRDNNVVRVVPRRDPNDDGVKVEDISGGRLTSGYLARAADVMPKQGDRGAIQLTFCTTGCKTWPSSGTASLLGHYVHVKTCLQTPKMTWAKSWARFWDDKMSIELRPRFPWRGGVDYITDLIHVTFGGLKQDSLEFTIGTDKN